MNQPKVSVIVPIYNVESYIETCVQNLFQQTLAEIEYIFVDDCSTDKSIAILKNIIQKYPDRIPQMKIIHHSINSGQAKSREDGFKVATGEYVIYCDPDDYPDIQMYKKLYDMASVSNADIVWCDYFRVEKNSKNIIKQESPLAAEAVLQSYMVNGNYEKRIMPFLWNRLFKRSLIDSNFIWPEHNMAEDLAIVFQVTINSKRIRYLSEPLYFYRVTPNSISRVTDENKQYQNYIGTLANTDIALNKLSEIGIDKVLKKYIIALKFSCKESLVPLLLKKEYRLLYKSTYSEINKYIYTNPFISFFPKIRAFLIHNKMYQGYLICVGTYRSLKKMFGRL